MVNRDLASIGKILGAAGFFSVIFGFSLFAADNGGLCSQPPGSNGSGCATDYNPLVLPTIIGGALIVAVLGYSGYSSHIAGHLRSEMRIRPMTSEETALSLACDSTRRLRITLLNGF